MNAAVPTSSHRSVPLPPPLSPRPPEARSFAGALRELTAHKPVDETLQLLLELATELVVGCDLGDVMLLGQGRIVTPVGTHPVAGALDRLQQSTGEGPCLAATLDVEPLVRVDDLADGARWPRFGPRAADLGVRSLISYGIYLGRGRTSRLGAMNLYGHRPHAFDAGGIELGRVLADRCAAVLASEIGTEGLRDALETRHLVGQAKQVLMDRHLCTASRAFSLLQRSAHDRDMTLRDVAHRVDVTGHLP